MRPARLQAVAREKELCHDLVSQYDDLVYSIVQSQSGVHGGTMSIATDLCFSDDGRIVLLDSTLREYSVEIDRCNTPEKILSWVIYLGTKAWIMKKHLELFVLHAAQANGIELDHSGWI
jgi:hypothetical protein